MEKSHKKLEVWKKGVELSIDIYKATSAFPSEERYGLISQLRRAAVSVPANIAEGTARNTKKELLNFLYMSRGSLSELDTHLEIAKRLSYLTKEQYEQLLLSIEEVDKMLSGFIKSINSKLLTSRFSLFSSILLLASCFSLLASSAMAEEKVYKINVEGMHCKTCVYRVTKSLKKLKQVKDVNVNLDEGTAMVTLNDGEDVTQEALNEAIEDSGYKPNGVKELK